MPNNSVYQPAKQTFGRYMKRTRSEQGLSQQEVERRGGPSQTWQSEHENETDVYYGIPKASMIIRLAKAYGVPIAEVEEAAGLQRGASLPPLPEAPDEFGEINGRKPYLMETGDVVYLIPSDAEPKITAFALDAFLAAWRKARPEK